MIFDSNSKEDSVSLPSAFCATSFRIRQLFSGFFLIVFLSTPPADRTVANLEWLSMADTRRNDVIRRRQNELYIRTPVIAATIYRAPSYVHSKEYWYTYLLSSFRNITRARNEPPTSIRVTRMRTSCGFFREKTNENGCVTTASRAPVKVTRFVPSQQSFNIVIRDLRDLMLIARLRLIRHAHVYTHAKTVQIKL